MRLSNLFHSVSAAEFNDLLKKGNKTMSNKWVK